MDRISGLFETVAGVSSTVTGRGGKGTAILTEFSSAVSSVVSSSSGTSSSTSAKGTCCVFFTEDLEAGARSVC